MPFAISEVGGKGVPVLLINGLSAPAAALPEVGPLDVVLGPPTRSTMAAAGQRVARYVIR